LTATNLNHVSIGAPDLERSVRFYQDLFGLEELPTPNFGFPVRWLRVGKLQLHLFQRPAGDAPRDQHLALTVDNFEAVYSRAKELGIFDNKAFGHHLYELPGSNVQMYIRDPGGNLIEVDWPDVHTLDRALVTDLRPLPERQVEENLHATLFLSKPESIEQ
jgi:lactoylglutathione lyase